jgi:GTP-dependent phosphoenolpyruvate carboxykinase
MEDRLKEIKNYCKHYDYLDFVNLKDLNWMIQTIEQLHKEISLLCPIADLPVIETLKVEKLMYMETVGKLERENERLKKVNQVTNDDWIEQHKEIVRYRKALEEIAGNRCCGFHWKHKELAEKLLG